MERSFIDKLTALAVKCCERGDVVTAKQIAELAILAQRSRIERMAALFDFLERVERLVDGGSSQAPPTEQSV